MTRTNNTNTKYSKGFRESCNKLKFLFPKAFQFFDNLENNYYKDFWMGTSKNAHLYYKNFYLAHITVSLNHIIFSPTIQGSIADGTSDNHRLLFAEVLVPELKEAKANKLDWIRYDEANIIVTNKAPEEFFDRMIESIKNM